MDVTRLWRRLTHALRASSHDRELQDEIAFHLEMKAEALQADGVADAEAAARRAFGSVVASRERSREAWGLLWWHDLVADLRYGLRSLWRAPRFALAAILTLALGIGANAAVFSVLHAVLVRPLPYADPARLVSLAGGQSLPDVLDIAAASRTLAAVGAWADWPLDSDADGRPVRIEAALVGGDLFAALGVPAHRGRVFGERDNRAGLRIAVLSHGFWQRRFAEHADVIGQPLRLNGDAYEIVGVMPPGFTLPAGRSEVWIPSRVGYPEAQDARGAHFMQAAARLAPTASIDAAREELSAIGRDLLARHPEEARADYPVLPLHAHLVRAVHAPLLVLMAGVSLVLLVACATFANLLLARTARREGELRVRTALGAGRWRLARQLVAESVLLAVLGGTLGATIAVTGVDLARLARPAGLPDFARATAVWPVLAWAFALALLTGVALGIIPAIRLRAHRPGLGAGPRVTAGGALVRRGLVVAQVALAVVLMAGAVLLGRSFRELQHVPLGFDPEGVLTLRVALPAERYADIGSQHAFVTRLTQELDAMPGVGVAGLVGALPLSGARIMHNLLVEGQPPVRPGEEPEIYSQELSATGLSALGIPLQAGRGFTQRDTEGAPLVGIVNERFVREMLGGEPAIGRRVRWARLEPEQWITIVGVVADARFEAVDEPQPATLYTPMTQKLQPWKRWAAVVVRPQAGEPMALAPAVTAAVWAVDPALPVTDVQPLARLVGEALAARRLQTWLMGLFAGVALALAVTGLYGVVSYLVAERAAELGVRMAVGATPRTILALVLSEGVRLGGGGLLLGLATALVATRVLERLLFAVEPTDPVSFALVGGAVTVAVVAATALPARRAARVVPWLALRADH